MRFGFSNTTNLKFDILAILDREQVPISSHELVRRLGYSNVETVKQILRELQKDIQNTYKPEEFNLTISRRLGVYLTRSYVGIQQLFDYLITKELAYTIYKETMFHPEVQSAKFIENNYTTESSIRRKIKEMNSYISNYRVSISFGTVMKLNGSEYSKRYLTFVFMFIIHRRITAIPWIENAMEYIELARNISEELGFGFRRSQLEFFALWIYITDCALKNNKKLELPAYLVSVTERINFPACPSLLEHWSALDWNFIMLAMYTYDLYRFDVTSFIETEEAECVTITEQWIEAFELQLAELTKEQKQLVRETATKGYVQEKMFKFDDNLAANWPIIRWSIIKEEYPVYYRKFAKFWDKYCELNPTETLTNKYARAYSFFLCNVLYPLENNYETIKLYIFSDVNKLYVAHLQERIRLYFKGKYIIEFMDTKEDADLVIGSTLYTQKEVYAQKYIQTVLYLPQVDLEKIAIVIEEIIQKRLENDEY